MSQPQQQSTSDSAQNSNQDNASSAAPKATQTDAPDWYKNPPPWFKPEAPQQQSQQQNQSGSGQTVAQELMSRLDALPEKIASFINEAKPKTPESNSDGSSTAATGSTTGAGETRTPGQPQGKTRQEKFRDWWFNG